jgi:hypothetical protein
MTTPDCHEPRQAAPNCCKHALTAAHPKAPVYCCKGQPSTCHIIELWDEYRIPNREEKV